MEISLTAMAAAMVVLVGGMLSLWGVLLFYVSLGEYIPENAESYRRLASRMLKAGGVLMALGGAGFWASYPN